MLQSRKSMTGQPHFATSRYSVPDFTWESGVALRLQLKSFDFTSSHLNLFHRRIFILFEFLSKFFLP